MLVDDHTILREGLRNVLEREPDIEVVAEAADGSETLRRVRTAAPDVIVMDIGLPGLGSIETTRRVRADSPQAKVVALSSHLNRHVLMQMLDAGVSGYVVKSAGCDELLRAIRIVMQNNTYLCPESAAILVGAIRDKKAAQSREKQRLGRREWEVLQLVADGRTSPQIARQLYIATGTVEVHRRNIMRKLELHSVAELTKYAIRNGLTFA